MQELEIKFEPPDVLGVPPLHEVGVAVGVADPLPSQPSSLPLFTAHSDLSPSYRSLRSETGSPQLLTPSQFLPPRSTSDLLQMPSDFETTSPKYSLIDQSSFTAVTTDLMSSVELPTEQITNSETDISNRHDNDNVLLLEIERAVSKM